MNKYTEILSQLRDCPDCGNDDVSWCSISHRPFCDCGKWGSTNFGSDQDAIDDWNKKTEHEELLELREELEYYKKLEFQVLREFTLDAISFGHSLEEAKKLAKNKIKEMMK